MKKLVILLSLIAFSQMLWSQTEYDDEVPSNSEEEFVGFNKKESKVKKDLSRIRIGGTAGFGIANNQISFNISPLVGYQLVEDRIEVGAGIIYDFYRYKVPRLTFTVNTPGINTYARLYIWEGVFVQARAVYQWAYVKENGLKFDPIGYGNVFGGVGYQFQISEKVFFNTGLEINIIPFDPNIISSGRERVISPFFNIQFAL
jgi:hypothetical protein